MGRISSQDKLKYQLVGSEEICFYCESPHVAMEDFTPAHTAPDRFKALFPEKWTRTSCCNACWRKIYTANVFNAGAKYGVPKGCMTLVQKQHLVRGTGDNQIHGSLVRGFKRFVVPSDLMQLNESTFVFKGNTIYLMELTILQAVLVPAMHGSDRPILEAIFEAIMMSDYLEQDKIPVYRDMCEIELAKGVEVPEFTGW